jgi:exosortase/archaeosortase family protein
MIGPLARTTVLPFNEFLAWSTAAVLSVTAGADISSSGTSVSGAGFGFTIAEGCNGIYALAIVLAGIVAIPMGRRHKLIGLALATALIMFLNYIRILSLWYAGISSPFWFEILHTYLWEFIIIAVGLLFLYFWYERFVKAA